MGKVKLLVYPVRPHVHSTFGMVHHFPTQLLVKALLMDRFVKMILPTQWNCKQYLFLWYKLSTIYTVIFIWLMNTTWTPSAQLDDGNPESLSEGHQNERGCIVVKR